MDKRSVTADPEGGPALDRQAGGDVRSTPADWVFFDETCSLCRAAAKRAARVARSQLRFAPLKGAIYQSLVATCQTPRLPDSVVVRTAEGELLTRSAAVAHVLSRLGRGWDWLGRALSWTPRPAREWAYGLVARRRHGLSRGAAWVRLLRLRFYPLSVVVYAMGVALGYRPNGGLGWAAGLWGLAAVVLLQMAAVVTNEIYDLGADELNTRHSFFNGGSRVLVNRELAPRAARSLLFAVSGTLLLLSALGLTFLAHGTSLAGGLLGAGALLAYGYTGPPFRLCYRGLGEPTVAGMYSFYLFILGYSIQAGTLPGAAVVTAYCLPLFLAILAAIVAANIPDAPADARAGKRTWPVLLGPRHALALVLTLASAALGSWLFFWIDQLSRPTVAVATALMAAQLAAQAVYALVHRERIARELLVHTLVTSSLGYTVWFALAPLVLMAGA